MHGCGLRLAVLAAALPDDWHVVHETAAVSAEEPHLARLNLFGLTAVVAAGALAAPVLHFLPRTTPALGVQVQLPVLDPLTRGSCKRNFEFGVVALLFWSARTGIWCCCAFVLVS